MTRARELPSRFVLLLAVCAWNVAAGQVVHAPRVSGPIAVTAPPGDPSHNYPFASTRSWLKPFDYQEDEFYIEGDAVVYVADGVNTSTVAPGGPYAFKTRVVVHRPRNAARFNGTVILEWITVSGGQDQENAWIWAHEHLMRSGYAHVSVSAQQRGVTALKSWNPARYGSLDVNAGGRFAFDLSYDIFSQAAYALKHPGTTKVLGDLAVRNIVATGHSSSAARTGAYYNSVQPFLSAPVIDGFVFLGYGPHLRSDVPTPAWKVLAEEDLLDQAANREEDSRSVRVWQIAGAAHAGRDLIESLSALLQRDLGPRLFGRCDKPMLSDVPAHFVQEAAYDWMKQWIEHGTEPPRAPRLVMDVVAPAGDQSSRVARDAFGIARGGIRLAHVAVPIATNDGVNAGEQYCNIYGSHVPFADSTLARLYPTHDAYVAAVNRVTAENLKDGYITKDSAAQINAEAVRSSIGRPKAGGRRPVGVGADYRGRPPVGDVNTRSSSPTDLTMAAKRALPRTKSR